VIRLVSLVALLGLASAGVGSSSSQTGVRNGVVAFQRGLGFSPTAQIWSVRADGRGERLLVGADTHGLVRLEWDPDGRRIAFLSDDRPGQLAYVAAANGTKQKLLLGSARTNGARIVVMNADGTGLKTLTKTPGYNGYPAWSPDGRKIAFSSNRGGQFQIYAMNPNGSRQARLTHDRSFDTAPSWQPLR
jgi:dipeptidyl aminopeptidase/acylaminoacyl peptidase